MVDISSSIINHKSYMLLGAGPVTMVVENGMSRRGHFSL